MDAPEKYIKIKLSGGSLRGPTKNAECKELPKLGQPFRCVAEPFEGGICRLIETSPVVTIVPDGFVTASGSRYVFSLEAD